MREEDKELVGGGLCSRVALSVCLSEHSRTDLVLVSSPIQPSRVDERRVPN